MDTVELQGQALDIAVAERVMGWTTVPGYNYWMTLHGDGNFNLHGLKATWKPSGALVAAFEVVDKMRAEGWQFRLDDQGGNPWWAEFATAGFAHGGQATADTPALAICRAALNAIADKRNK